MAAAKTNGMGWAAKEIVERARSVAKLEIELALLEVRRKLVKMAVGTGLGAGAAIVALFALGFIAAGAAAGIATALPVWAALLIVGGRPARGDRRSCSARRALAAGRYPARAGGRDRGSPADGGDVEGQLTGARSPEDVKREIEAEREQLGAAVGTLRTRAGAAARKLPLVVLGAAGLGLGARSVGRRIFRSFLDRG